MNICLGWGCDSRNNCKKYLNDNPIKPDGSIIHYFLPLNVGEHCESWEKKDEPE